MNALQHTPSTVEETKEMISRFQKRIENEEKEIKEHKKVKDESYRNDLIEESQLLISYYEQDIKTLKNLLKK